MRLALTMNKAQYDSTETTLIDILAVEIVDPTKYLTSETYTFQDTVSGIEYVRKCFDVPEDAPYKRSIISNYSDTKYNKDTQGVVIYYTTLNNRIITNTMKKKYPLVLQDYALMNTK